MGLSDEWRGGTTPQYQAQRLLRLMDYWQLERAHVVGTDMGGQPALVFAAENPERIISLTVMNSLVVSDETTSWEIGLLRRFRLNRLFLMNTPRLVFERAVRTSLRQRESLPQEVRKDFWQAFSLPAVRRFIVRMCAGYQGQLPRLPEYYQAVKCPTLLLWGEHDCHFPPAHAKRLSDFISHAEMRTIAEGSHWAALENPRATADALLNFLSRKEPA